MARYHNSGTQKFDDLESESLNSTEINNVKRVEPGESIQSVLNNLNRPSSATPIASWARVDLTPDATYNEKITIPNYTILNMNGAYIQPTTDGDVVTLGGPGAELWGPGRILAGAGYTFTGTAIGIFSSDFDVDIQTDNDNTVAVRHFPQLVNNGANGDLLTLEASGTNSISVGNVFKIHCRSGDRQIVIRTNDGQFINGSQITYIGDTKGSSVAIEHENTAGAAAEGRAHIDGDIQLRGSLDYGIRNSTTERASVEYMGELWDPQNPSNAAISGPGIRVGETRVRPDQTDFGLGTSINGLSKQALGGSAPDATNWDLGIKIADTDNPGDVYLIYDDAVSGGAAKISP